tara:strand:+ start:435 stop:782 length:348 start_codon:yes stop_codon:yes gene_type:complete
MKYLLPLLALVLTGCQINYTLPMPENMEHTGHHGAGMAYLDSCDAVFLARDLTDEELDDAYPYPGVGYDDSKWCGSNADEVELAAQQVFQCDDGTVIILEDNGDIIVLDNPSTPS